MKRIRSLPAIALLSGLLAAPAAFAQDTADQRGIVDCGARYAVCIIAQSIFTCTAKLALCLMSGGQDNGSASMDRRD
jgi:hypothetical protein